MRHGNDIDDDGCSNAASCRAVVTALFRLVKRVTMANGPTDTCRSTVAAECGDGIVQAGEECDDGNGLGGTSAMGMSTRMCCR